MHYFMTQFLLLSTFCLTYVKRIVKSPNFNDIDIDEGTAAVIGHIERAWPSSFLWGAIPDGTLPHQTVAFESTLRLLLNGYPVGAAVEFLNERHAELASMLSALLEDIQVGAPYDRADLISYWMGDHDAAGYVVIGDPAVRLPVA